MRSYNIICPVHGATFDIRDGSVTGLPLTVNSVKVKKKAAPGAGAAYNTVSGFLRWAPELQECSHQLIESRIDRIHADPDPNTVAGVFIHSAVVDFTLVTPVDVPGNDAFLIVPNSLQVASLFENGVMR